MKTNIFIEILCPVLLPLRPEHSVHTDFCCCDLEKCVIFADNTFAIIPYIFNMRKITNAELMRPTVEEFARADKTPLAVVLEDVRSALNVGSFFRTCDAFAVERIELCGITATPPDREIHKTALGAEQTVPWHHWASAAEAVGALRGEGYRILAVEQVEGAALLGSFTPVAGERYALVFGNEVEGVRQSTVDLCDGAIEIPQLGTKHSLTVSVAGGVVLWDLFCRIGLKI